MVDNSANIYKTNIYSNLKPLYTKIDGNMTMEIQTLALDRWS